MKEVDKAPIKKRIKELEANIAAASIQIDQYRTHAEELSRRRISMQGGIIELKKLLGGEK